PARAAAHLLLAEGADYLTVEEHLAQAVTDSAADPGLRAEALAMRALMQVQRVEQIAGAEQVASEALAGAGPAGPGAGGPAAGGGAGGGRRGRRAPPGARGGGAAGHREPVRELGGPVGRGAAGVPR